MKESIFAVLLFAASCLTLVPVLPRRWSFVVFALVFVGVLLSLWSQNRLAVTFHPGVLIGTLLVWIALTIGFVQAPTLDGLLRLGAFIVITGGILFVLPSALPTGSMFRAIGVVAAILVLIGLPAVFVGPIGQIGVWISPTAPVVGEYIPTSVLGNPNTLGYIAVLGAIAAAGVFLTDVSRTQTSGLSSLNTVLVGVIAVICTLGAVLSVSRGALLTLLAGGGVLIVAHTAGRSVTGVLTVIGMAALAGFMLIATGLISGPDIFQSINLNGRAILWQSSLRATAERPFFGWGPGADAHTLAPFVPSDSYHVGDAPGGTYIRMFFIGGLVGGIGHLVLSASGLWTAFADAHSWQPTIAALVVATSIAFIFEGSTVFGLRPLSVVGAFVVGVAQLGCPRSRSIPLRSLIPNKRFTIRLS